MVADVVLYPRPDAGRPASVPATALIDFTAQAFREVEKDSDVWEFRVMGKTSPGAPTAAMQIYIAGSDLVLVRAPSKVL